MFLLAWIPPLSRTGSVMKAHAALDTLTRPRRPSVETVRALPSRPQPSKGASLLGIKAEGILSS
mgnify:CR=1 FL=1